MQTIPVVGTERKRSTTYLVAALLGVAFACGLLHCGAGSERSGGSSHSEKTGVTSAALSTAQCEYFETNGKTTICHATSSTKNPYVLIKVSESACVNAHASHPRDFIDVSGGNCNNAACLPETAPCDPTLPCCGTLSCAGGSCQCPAGQTFCEVTCVDTTSDPNNCGGCGLACTGVPCTGGACCPPPTRGPVQQCGAPPPPPPPAGCPVYPPPPCFCPSGQTECRTMSGPSCSDLTNDPNNCGACGNVCPSGVACTGGACGAAPAPASAAPASPAPAPAPTP
jgi:hypothetical protein